MDHTVSLSVCVLSLSGERVVFSPRSVFDTNLQLTGSCHSWPAGVRRLVACVSLGTLTPASPSPQKPTSRKIGLFLRCVARLRFSVGRSCSCTHPLTSSTTSPSPPPTCRSACREWPCAPRGCWPHPVCVAVAAALRRARTYGRTCSCVLTYA